ncbi:unnamed protein product [Mytilus coruscus]|uniref:Integrase zinc-binding domain-containing protein n=1 Tax=Mytilus coruscus TaxID=42192 RepID=A0A6J8E682_MYTCO|nr:unnamed protein product [Mytilus coruscus]
MHAGHVGMHKTLENTRQSYYWPSLHSDVRAYLAGCSKCTRRKHSMLRKCASMRLEEDNGSHESKRPAWMADYVIEKTENSLMYALSTGKLKLAKILIEGGQDINFCNSSGVTPLMLASNLEVGDENIPKKLLIIKCIIDNKANMKAVDNIGRTALMYALHSGCKQTIQLLKTNGLVDSIHIRSRSTRTKSMDNALFTNI